MTEIKSFVYTLACSEGTRLSGLWSAWIIIWITASISQTVYPDSARSDSDGRVPDIIQLLWSGRIHAGNVTPVNFSLAVWQDKVLHGKRAESTASSRHGLVVVKMDPFWAGDLHHCSMQIGVHDQPHHPLCYQRRPACRHREGKRIRGACTCARTHVHTQSHKQRQRVMSFTKLFSPTWI